MKNLGLFANILGLGTAIYGLCVNDIDLMQQGLILQTFGVIIDLKVDVNKLNKSS